MRDQSEAEVHLQPPLNVLEKVVILGNLPFTTRVIGSTRQDLLEKAWEFEIKQVLCRTYSSSVETPLDHKDEN